MKLIIFLSGGIKSGKDTIGEYLVKNYNFKRYAFADKVKDDVSDLFKIRRDIMDTHEGKNKLISYNITVRDIIINYANNKRDEEQDYWTKIVIENIKKNNYDNIVITDFRYINEYNTIKNEFKDDYKIITINIIREIDDENKHINCISETSLNSFIFDFILYNKTLLDSYTFIDNIIRNINV